MERSEDSIDASHNWRIVDGDIMGSSNADESRGLVCLSTETFRNLTTMVRSSDLVLEIGCSFGRCTELLGLAVGSPTQVVGIDVSREIVKAASADYPHLVFRRGDVLKDPRGTIDITNELIARNPTRRELCVFVDVGGNRELETLVILLPWVASVLPLVPRLIVVKSETLHAAVVERGSFDWQWLKVKARAAISARREGRERASKRMKRADDEAVVPEARRMPHPKNAPERKNTEGTPICRYHNYSKRGCLRYLDPNKLGSECPFDHETCHWCGTSGHTALCCSDEGPLI